MAARELTPCSPLPPFCVQSALRCRRGLRVAESAAKLAASVREHELARKEVSERIAGFVKRNLDDSNRIRALQREVAALKAAAAAPRAEPLAQFLERLNLQGHCAALEEEELDVELLRSMGPEVLAGNMAMLGLSPPEVARIVDGLCPKVG